MYHIQHTPLEMAAAHTAYPDGREVEVGCGWHRRHSTCVAPAVRCCNSTSLAVRCVLQCYCKLVCERGERGRVLGVHILGPSAGEVLQGMAVAMRLGATKVSATHTQCS